MSYKSFVPPIRTLMGPGPSDVHPRILSAMAKPTIGHLDPEFIRMMDEVKQLLQYAFQTQNQLTLPVSAPGSAGMETCFVNLVEPNDKVVICNNGAFGGRMKENVLRLGAEPIMIDYDWGHAIDPAQLEDTLKKHPDATTVAFVHAETSTGVQADAKSLVKIAHQHDCLTIVDAVTSLGGSALKVDEWEIDAIYSGSQKCLSCTPGLSPISFNQRAIDRIQNRKHRVQSWFLDLNLVMGYWGENTKRAYHHTAPINSLYGLHEALIILHEETLETAWQRHKQHHEILKAGLEAMGIKFLVAPAAQLPQLNSICIPSGVDDATVRQKLLSRYHLEIGAGLGPLAGKVWRIGLMGYGSNIKNIMYCLHALECVLIEENAPIKHGAAMQAVNKLIAKNNIS